ncbi:hypothetical protein ARMSODRAFT_892030 [Armillaria solidipes]|uniref:Uncharacterized protein n=1 Tax=Armillaria solidipes TaxID=1076256 RepID=A0A2H3B6R1_9AGAR|nr:hypothetical protein ARMSODRAFT_892030 [Armillaria solidipes]
MCISSSSPVPYCRHSGHKSSIPASEPPLGSLLSNTSRGVSEPQCCHCGWRGAHAPGCPFG